MISEEKQRSVLTNHILPLFSGATLLEETVLSHKGEQLVATAANKIKLKFDKNSTERYIINRSQPFTGKDCSLIKCFLQKISSIDEAAFYTEAMYDICLEKAICEDLSSIVHNTIETIIDIFTSWSLRTYEGKHPSFGVIIDTTQKSQPHEHEALKVENCMLKDHAAPLTDGVSSYFMITCDGYILSHKIIEGSADCDDIFAPYRFINFAEKCDNNNIGLVLLSSGEILIFADKELKYAKRQGKWKLFDHKTAIKRLSDRSKYMNESIRNAMYLTALDVSFSKTGGCIGYINKTEIKGSYSVVNEGDRLINNPNMNDKAMIVNRLVGETKFQAMPRKMRQELIGIDGATIIDSDGHLIACGAIIRRVKSSVEGGGRLAATKQLSTYGTAIKISTDGGISAYHKESKVIAIG